MIIDAVFQEESILDASFGALTRGEKGDKGEKGKDGSKHLIFDTQEHLLSWEKGEVNYLPIEEKGYITKIYDDGSFDIALGEATSPSISKFTIEAGEYLFTTNEREVNSSVGFFLSFDGGIAYSGDSFTVTETGTCHFVATGNPYSTGNGLIATITRADETPYEREDGLTVNDLNKGDMLLVEENNVPDYWWNGTEAKPIEADLGNIETALDSIIAIQESLIGGAE